MNEEKAKKRRNAKIRKWIITLCILVALIVAAILFVPRLLHLIKGETAVTSVTTYLAEAITYGDVDTTVSGSGTLSPVRSDTLNAPAAESTSTEEQNGGGEPGMQNTVTTAETPAYTLTELNVTAGDAFAEGDVLAVLTDEDDKTAKLTAEYDGVVLEITSAAGDTLTAGEGFGTIMSKEGFTVAISVDEQDIATVAQGQEVTVTVDAVSGVYTGTVSAISYNGTASGSTASYQLTAAIEYAEGIYPAMSASAEIVTESSGEGLLVPAEAVHVSGDDSYVYLAPSGAADGTEYEEDDLTLSDLTKVTVETGMSDGSYMLIESDQLTQGDLIIVTRVTSTLTGSDASEESGFDRGGFGGKMDFDGEMGDFAPGEMPGGGGGGGRPDFGQMQ